MDELDIKMGELFSGPGGIACGADMAVDACKNIANIKLTHSWANDSDENACRTYKRNIAIDPSNVYCEDVRFLKIGTLGNINALSFGFPCNDFSLVGERKGFSGEYGPLYKYGIKALKKYKPDWFLAENVNGLMAADKGKVLDVILNEMFDAKYDVFPNMYEFERYGVPQTRHRIIIVGFKKNLHKQFEIPATTHDPCTFKTSRMALEDPPIPVDAPNNERTSQTRTVVERLSYIKPGQNAFNADIPTELQLHVKGAKLSQIYRRLDPDKPAYTLTGSGGGGTHMYHWEEPRALTNRERARIQTFPDSFVFEGRKEDVRKQIGMAVPPLGAKVIFESIFKTMLDIPYDSMEPTMKPMIHRSRHYKISMI